MKKSTSLVAASVFLVTLGALVFASSLGEPIVPKVHADADKGCTTAGAAGTYGFLASGSVNGVGPIAVTGLLTADRGGNLVVTETINLNGIIIFPATMTGTISVNSDCTFTNSFSDGTTAAGVIVNGGREVDFIETVPGETISGVAKRRGGSDEE